MLNQRNCFTRDIDIPWKRFIRKSQNDSEVPSEKTEYRLAFQANEAKKVYEEIIKESDTKLQPEKYKYGKLRIHVSRNNAKTRLVSSNNDKTKKTTVEKVTINSILKAVEQKNLNFLLQHVTRENVNCTDDFGWTPLMSAAYCGHSEILEFLVSLGANRRARERSGLTAAQLALKKNYLNIVALLKKKTECSANKIPLETNTDESVDERRSEWIQSSIKCKNVDDLKEQSQKCSGFYCETCKVNFYQTTWKKHETSTLHIFNLKPNLSNTMYGISKQNKGYQMLLNTGWDEQGGLGPSGKGIKYPIKTYLKLDRKGLGQTSEKEYRVTHFKAGDAAAIGDLKALKPKCLKKRDREKLLNREVKKEIALRIALS